MSADPLAEVRGDRAFVVLDGPLATELTRRGHDLRDALWSARLLADDPDAIVRVHLDYFLAGADVATTATYQASVAGFAKRDISADRAAELLRSAVALADRARRGADAMLADGRRRLVLASLGSFGATLANGAEYSGDFGGAGHRELVAFHRERIALVAHGADLVLFETIPSVAELEAIAEAASASPIPVVVSCTIRDGLRLGSGDAIERMPAALAGAANIVALGVNCCAPWHVETALGRLGRCTTLPLVAYPNAGEHYDGRARRFVGRRLPDTEFEALARRYLAAGARAVGTCCRTGIGHIVALAKLRRALGQPTAR